MPDYTPPIHISADGSVSPLVGLSAYSPVPLTIVDGAITIPGAGLYIICPETGTTDDLDRIIHKCLPNERITLMAWAGATITLRNAVDNILTPVNTDELLLGHSDEDMSVCELVLHYVTWRVLGGGSTANAVMARSRHFVESDGPGTYTATVPIPIDATVLDVRFSNQFLWSAATARLNVGDADDPDGYFADVDLKTFPVASVNGAGGISSFQSGLGIGGYTPTNVTPDRSFDANNTSLDEIADVLGTVIGDAGTLGAGAYAGSTKYAIDGMGVSKYTTITATIVTTGDTGATGRSRLTVIYTVGLGGGAPKT